MPTDPDRPAVEAQWSYIASTPTPASVPVQTPVQGGSTRVLGVLSLVAVLVTAVVSIAVVRAVSARTERKLLDSRLESGPIEGPPGATYSYAWINRDGSPVRWNPCRPLHWVSNSRAAPPGGMADLAAAIARVSMASGIPFVHDGEVDEVADADRAPVQVDRYGDGWAPLLITWSRLTGPLGAALGADGATVGVATPVAVSRPERPGVLVTGQIVLESDVVVSPGFLTTRSQGAVMLHELSHALGLGHTNDNAQLLYEGGEPIAGLGELGPGDLAGLAAVGQGAGCVETPRPQDVD